MLPFNQSTQTKSPRVSVIIPAYNTAQYIGETLESVFAQRFRDYEVIVINDGSPDTAELERVLEPYRHALTYLVKENGGLASARNAGIQVARGEFIALLDSDDAWEPDYLAAQVGPLVADPTITVSYSNAIIFGNALEAGQDCMSVLPSAGEVTFQRLVDQECNVLVSALIRRTAFARVGLFDEELRTNEDYDLWLRIAHDGGRFVYYQRPFWRYRRRAGQLSGDPLVMWRGYLRVLEKTKLTLNLTPAERAAVERRCAHSRAMLKLFEGKQAFFAGDFVAALNDLTEANSVLNSRKLALAVQALRLAPHLLLRAYQARDRFVFKTNTRF